MPRTKEQLDAMRPVKLKKKRSESTKVTPLRREFVKQYLKNGGQGTQAMIAARAIVYPDRRYPNPVKTAEVTASMALKTEAVKSLISRADERMLREAEKSVQKMADLRDGSANEDVQLKASNHLVQAYLTVAKRLQDESKPDPSTTNILVTNMSTEEILARIERLKNGEGNA